MFDFPKPESLQTAADLQRKLAKQVVLEGNTQIVKTLAALDASIKRDEDLVAAAVLYDLDKGEVLEVGLAAVPPGEVFPYIPGFLSFREAAVYLAALSELSATPDLLLVDGQGILHPRGLGIGAHLGVHLDMPSIGVAKTHFFGRAQGELGEDKGNAVPITAQGKQLGWLYRSRSRVKPLYVSPGHRVSVAGALDLVSRLPGKTRLPDPLKFAHEWAGKARREGLRGRVEP